MKGNGKGNNDEVRIIMGLIDRIAPILAGHDPVIQGAVLCELTAVFMRGHHPVEFRRAIFNTHFEQIRMQIEDDDGGALNERTDS